MEVKRRRILEETRDIDADSDGEGGGDDDDSDSSSSSEEEDSDDEEDETAELLRELEKIKRERAEHREKEVCFPLGWVLRHGTMMLIWRCVIGTGETRG